jgi:hypothetical protein
VAAAVGEGQDRFLAEQLALDLDPRDRILLDREKPFDESGVIGASVVKVVMAGSSSLKELHDLLTVGLAQRPCVPATSVHAPIPRSGFVLEALSRHRDAEA